MTETTTKTQMPTLQPPELAPAANVPAVVEIEHGAPVAAPRKAERPARATTGDIVKATRRAKARLARHDIPEEVTDAIEEHADQLNAPLVAGHPELPAVAAPQPAPIVEGDTWELPAEVEKLTDEDRKKLVAYADRALSFPPETLAMSNEEHRAAVNAVFAIDPSAAIDMTIHRHVQGLQVEAAVRTVAAHRDQVAMLMLHGFVARTATLYAAEQKAMGKPSLFQTDGPALGPEFGMAVLEHLRSDHAGQRAIAAMDTEGTNQASRRAMAYAERKLQQRLASQPVTTGGQPPVLSEGQFASYRPYDAPTTDARPAAVSATGGKTLGAIINDMRAKRRAGFQPPQG